jgi:hypothetical protein
MSFAPSVTPLRNIKGENFVVASRTRRRKIRWASGGRRRPLFSLTGLTRFRLHFRANAVGAVPRLVKLFAQCRRCAGGVDDVGGPNLGLGPCSTCLGGCFLANLLGLPLPMAAPCPADREDKDGTNRMATTAAMRGQTILLLLLTKSSVEEMRGVMPASRSCRVPIFDGSQTGKIDRFTRLGSS